jgi:thiamine pyrophosphokinase
MRFAIGDFDSWPGGFDRARSSLEKRTEVVVASSEKDRSDLAMALDRLHETLKEEVTVLGGVGFLGGLSSHEHAALGEWELMLPKFPKLYRAIWMQPAWKVQKFARTLEWWKGDGSVRELTLPSGSRVSLDVSPLLPKAVGISTEGLKYELVDGTLKRPSHGLSNQSVSSCLRFTFREGWLRIWMESFREET